MQLTEPRPLDVLYSQSFGAISQTGEVMSSKTKPYQTEAQTSDKSGTSGTIGPPFFNCKLYTFNKIFKIVDIFSYDNFYRKGEGGG